MAETIQVAKPITSAIKVNSAFKEQITNMVKVIEAEDLDKASRNVGKANRKVSLSAVYSTQMLEQGGVNFAEMQDIVEKSKYLNAVDRILSVVCENAVIKFLKQQQ